MAGLVDITVPEDLRPVAAEAGAAEGDPGPVYTWTGPLGRETGLVRSYVPSDGGAPRLVADVGADVLRLCVWDSGTGALVRELRAPECSPVCRGLVTYQRRPDDRPRIAAVSDGGDMCIWDGDDLQVLHTFETHPGVPAVRCLAVYEEPISGRARLVTG
jgi:hypothetical protein